MPRRFKAVVSYDGTAYDGWQIQPAQQTVQQSIESAIEQITQEKVHVHGSGRTDAGVHASGQVLHFDAETLLPVAQLHKGINAVLPTDIRFNSIHEVSNDFHARFNAIGKEYRYHIWNGPIVPPFISGYRTQIRQSLDIERMRDGAEHFVGEHDFASFTANPNREVENTVRRIDRLQIFAQEEDIAIVVVGSGFLYKMVRTITGYLLLVGQGKLEPEDFFRIQGAKERSKDIPTAPATGLFLWRVFYPEDGAGIFLKKDLDS